MSFFNELHRLFDAPGDFAQAYVLAHEIEHHVQTLIGVERQVRQRHGADPRGRNELMELQADCFAELNASLVEAPAFRRHPEPL